MNKIKIKKTPGHMQPWFAWHPGCTLGKLTHTAWAAWTFEGAVHWTYSHYRTHQNAGR